MSRSCLSVGHHYSQVISLRVDRRIPHGRWFLSFSDLERDWQPRRSYHGVWFELSCHIVSYAWTSGLLPNIYTYVWREAEEWILSFITENVKVSGHPDARGWDLSPSAGFVYTQSVRLASDDGHCAKFFPLVLAFVAAECLE